MYKSLLPLNEESIFENVHFMVVKMKSGNMKMVNIKFDLLKKMYTCVLIFPLSS